MPFSKDDIQHAAGRVSNNNKTSLVNLVFKILNLDSVRIVKNLRGLSEAYSVLGEILNRFSVIPFESRSNSPSTIHVNSDDCDSTRSQRLSRHVFPHVQQQIHPRTQRKTSIRIAVRNDSLIAKTA